MQQGSKLGLAVAGCLSPIVKFVRYDLSPPPAEVPSAPGERDDEPDESDSSSDDDEPPLTRVVAGGLGRVRCNSNELVGSMLTQLGESAFVPIAVIVAIAMFFVHATTRSARLAGRSVSAAQWWVARLRGLRPTQVAAGTAGALSSTSSRSSRRGSVRMRITRAASDAFATIDQDGDGTVDATEVHYTVLLAYARLGPLVKARSLRPQPTSCIADCASPRPRVRARSRRHLASRPSGWWPSSTSTARANSAGVRNAGP